MIEAGAQNAMLAMGKTGCLFLCLVSIAEEHTRTHIDPYQAYKDCVSAGYMAKDCWCLDQCKMLSLMAGGTWTREVHDDVPAVVPDNMYTVLKYQRGNDTHFRRRGYDVYLGSQTVAKGRVTAVYCYTVREG